MFKQKKLALGSITGVLVAVGILTGVQAVHVNSDGTGQVLLFPYFNAHQGYVTNINLVNSTDETKAIKIRFRDGKNSTDILNFNLYMSPEDVWTGSIKAGQDGMGAISTLDRTCAMPLKMTATCSEPSRCEAFKSFENMGVVAAADTREGYVEVIEMGVVSDPELQAAVKHANGRPADCAAIENAWLKTNKFKSGVGSAATGLSAPTGGLFGSSAVLNIPKGSAFAIDPVALDNYSTQAQHYRPDVFAEYLLPSLASGNVTKSTVMTQKTNGETDMVVTNWKPLAEDPCSASGKDAPCGLNPYPVAHALTQAYLMNEYFLDPSDSYDGHTDWVVTFPMKKHGIHNAAADVVTKIDTMHDREESRAWSLGSVMDQYFGFVDSKGTLSQQASLNREVNILTFVSTDPSYDMARTTLASPNLQPVSTGPFVHGWARLAFPNYSLAAGFDSATAYGAAPQSYTSASNIYKGVPALGFAAMDGGMSNNPAARYGDALPHKTRH